MHTLILLLAPLPLAAADQPAAPAAAPRIRVVSETAVEVTGLAERDRAALARLALPADDWPKLFAVFVEQGGRGKDDPPPVLGSYRVTATALRFEPRFPLVRGVRYRAVLHPGRIPGHDTSEKPIEAPLLLAKLKTTASTVVAHVYPSKDRLPENLLKLYLHFSAPMSRGDVYRHIRLLDPAGKAVDLPFLELDEELWDAAGKRLTLFLDPGRIKRGLKPREDAGPILEEGKRYTLVIDRAWKDADGNPLKEAFRKTFLVLAPDDTTPDPKTWKLQAPAADSRAALVVTFPEALDHALLHRMLWVEDSRGRRVDGSVTVHDHETSWHFTPRQPWAPGAYHLVANKRLEDLAGNSIGRPFEVDAVRPVQRTVETETVRVPFVVRPASR